MDKIIGKYFFLSIIFCSSFLNAGMSLRIMDSDGMPLEQAGAGQPFKLEVTLSDISSFSKYPTIKGTEQFDMHTSGMRISTVNGKTTATYSYRIQIDEPGYHIIGPAELQVGRNRFVSNTLSVRVDDSAIAQTRLSKKAVRHKQSPAFMRLTTEKQNVVTGERIGCRLRFYFTDQRIALKQIILQESKQIDRSQMRGPFTGTEKIDGTTYHYAEWTWDSYASAAGRQMIPAYGVDYEQEVEQDRQFWGGFARFFGNRIERKRIYSNAVSLQVAPLPAHEDIQSVGSFSYLHLSAQPSAAKQGEGIIITVELAGDGNMHAITMPKLQKVPSELKYYESKQSIIEPRDQSEQYKKRFEFVVQGLKTGSWEIPAQQFTYYDVKQKRVKTVQSAPLTVTIMPGSAKAIMPFDDNRPDKKPIAHLHEKGPWYPASEGWRLSWWMIILLMITPIALLIMRGMMLHFRTRVKIPYELIREKYAFSNAKKRFAKLKAERDAQRLYALFIELMANKCKTSLAAITVPFIMLRLQQAAVQENRIEEWNQFFKHITERAYGTATGEIDEQLFKQAEQWLEDLQKVL